MKNIFFDICSIPLFLMIIWICISRKMTKGNVNRLFLAMTVVSLLCAAADLSIEFLVTPLPLSQGKVLAATLLSYFYLVLRNSTIAVLFLFMLSLTHTTELIAKRWIKAAFCVPYLITLLALIQNIVTHNVFTVTAAAGYARGPMMMVLYAMAAIYGIAGFGYCIICRSYLSGGKWVSLVIMFVLVYLSVAIQYFRPDLLVEMFCTAVGNMMIMLTVMRPEERMDSDVGMLSWSVYQTDLRNILRSGERVQILVIRMLNCREIRTYLGDHKYNQYLAEIAREIRSLNWRHHHRIELYFERPGTIYLIVDAAETGAEDFGARLLEETGERIRQYAEMGVRFEPRVCLIHCPEDLDSASDIISLGHKFQKIDKRKQITFRASEIVHSRTFAIEARMEEILERAIKEARIEMYYQPIYDVHSGCFHSAEALARIDDPEFGIISPSIFIPAAETLGLIVPIGNAVLEQVFRFVSEHDLRALGLSYIELNLSVAQCMQSSLPETLRTLQEKYGVDPGQINLEITETTFENISEVMLENVNELISMGYSFALDDYGIGYSSIQRVNHLPLKLIKIDKSMLDEISSTNGRMILEHTVRMMQSINKQLVVEGAETADEVDVLERMDCDYIQGFYFSKPLPETLFLQFIEAHNGRSTA